MKFRFHKKKQSSLEFITFFGLRDSEQAIGGK